jgi:hypothetical protein
MNDTEGERRKVGRGEKLWLPVKSGRAEACLRWVNRSEFEVKVEEEMVVVEVVMVMMVKRKWGQPD